MTSKKICASYVLKWKFILQKSESEMEVIVTKNIANRIAHNVDTDQTAPSGSKIWDCPVETCLSKNLG